MAIYNKAFWFISFFLIGILLASFINGWQDRILFAALAALFVAAVVAASGEYELAALALAIFVGASYYFVFDMYAGQVKIPFGEKTEATGMVQKASVGLEKQDVVIALEAPYNGRVKITTQRYPTWEYGDRIEIKGTIKAPPEQSARRLEKDGIYGVISFPKMELLSQGAGSPLKAMLFKIKSYTESAIHRTLPPEQAAFMNGLLLGDTAEFSKEFRDKMSLTGTSHLVALSGYNISVVANGIAAVLSYFLSRRKTFWFSTLAIIGFVVMTGAEASVVRAAIMGFIVLLAGHVERVHSFRNSLAVAAFFMILANPKVLVWDIGFQLSFAAILGLAYLRPAIEKLLKLNPNPGILKWKENLLTTTSAQLAVIPILLSQFGSFSFLGFITNVLILTFVPWTMLVGFLVVLASLFSSYAALVIGWIASVFVGYELWVIDVFSHIPAKIAAVSFPIWMSAAYYLMIAGIVIYAKKKPNGFQTV